jgi:hypothetical protein
MAVSRWLMGHLRKLEHRFLSTHVKYKLFLMTQFPAPLNKFQTVNIFGPLKSFPILSHFVILALHMALLSLDWSQVWSYSYGSL